MKSLAPGSTPGSTPGSAPTPRLGRALAEAQLAPLPDEDLVPEILSGNSVAFELLMRRHNQRLFRLARAVLGNNSEAEEVVQEAYVRAYEHLHRFEGRAKLITWLSRIALHEALRCRRKRRRRRSMTDVEVDRMRPAHDDAPNPSPAERDEERVALARAVDALPAMSRAVVMLRLVEEMSTRETAESLRMSEANVKVTLHRAREALRERLERHAVAELREEFSFGETRCDRVVAGVFAKLALRG